MKRFVPLFVAAGMLLIAGCQKNSSGTPGNAPATTNAVSPAPSGGIPSTSVPENSGSGGEID